MTTAPSLVTLDDVLAPMSVEAFTRDIYGRGIHHHSHGSDRFQDLLPWPTVSRWIAEGNVLPPRMSFARRDRGIAPGSYGSVKGPYKMFTVDPVQVSRHLNEGATVAIHRVDVLHDPVRELAADIEHRLAATVTGEVYASFHPEAAFVTHWDAADVLVLQIAGEKQWRVWEMTRPDPLEVDSQWPDYPEGPPKWEGILRAGDVFYMPRGYWHDVIATTTGPSLHLSLFINRPTGIDVLRWLAQQAMDIPAFRRDLPAAGDDRRITERTTAMSTAANGLWTEDIIASFVDARAAIAEPRPSVNLPSDAYRQRMPDHGDVWLRGRPPLPVRVREGASGLEIDALQRTWTFASEARQLVALITDRQRHTVEDWYAAGAPLQQGRIHQFIVELLTEGLVEVVAAPG